jgi:hypothetical protein
MASQSNFFRTDEDLFILPARFLAFKPDRKVEQEISCVDLALPLFSCVVDVFEIEMKIV